MNHIRSRRTKGFTLAEALIAMTILAAAAGGLLLPFASGAAVQAEAANRTIAAKLAADMMEKIKITDFADIVATYNGYSEAQGQVRDVNGVILADAVYANFSRSVTCQLQMAFGTQPVIFVSVDVDYNGNSMIHLPTMLVEQ